jgi:hypothetical protein
MVADLMLLMLAHGQALAEMAYITMVTTGAAVALETQEVLLTGLVVQEPT